MLRHRWSIAQVAFVGLLAVLAFPGAGSALRPQFVISLTPTGASPAVLTTTAGGLGPIFFSNTDTVTHTVSFANGSCSIQVAPGTRGQCGSDFMDFAGDYAYTVDGKSQAQLVVEAVGRSVSLTARSHSVGRRSRVRLQGILQDANGSPPSAGSPQPITVLARPDRYHAFRRIAVVGAKLAPRSKAAPLGELVWQLHVQPRAKTIYIAEANYQPKAGQVWQRAWSKPFRVRVAR